MGADLDASCDSTRLSVERVTAIAPVHSIGCPSQDTPVDPQPPCPSSPPPSFVDPQEQIPFASPAPTADCQHHHHHHHHHHPRHHHCYPRPHSLPAASQGPTRTEPLPWRQWRPLIPTTTSRAFIPSWPLTLASWPSVEQASPPPPACRHFVEPAASGETTGPWISQPRRRSSGIPGWSGYSTDTGATWLWRPSRARDIGPWQICRRSTRIFCVSHRMSIVSSLQHPVSACSNVSPPTRHPVASRAVDTMPLLW